METSYRPDLFKGQVALVTGGGSGIGREIAMRFAALGAKVLVCGRKQDTLDETCGMIREAGGEAEPFALNIREPERCLAAVAHAWELWERLDTLVNNAGGQFGQAAIDISTKGWNAVIDTNLNGTWHMMQAAAKSWRDRERGGSIINIVLDIQRGIPGMAHSVAARGGVIYLSKTVAVEWAPLGIRVNCIAPGLIKSSGFELYEPAVQRKSLHDSNPMRRMGETADIAEGCLYLASPGGRFVTGEVLTIDGGQQMWGDVWAIAKPDYFRFED